MVENLLGALVLKGIKHFCQFLNSIRIGLSFMTLLVSLLWEAVSLMHSGHLDSKRVTEEKINQK